MGKFNSGGDSFNFILPSQASPFSGSRNRSTGTSLVPNSFAPGGLKKSTTAGPSVKSTVALPSQRASENGVVQGTQNVSKRTRTNESTTSFSTSADSLNSITKLLTPQEQVKLDTVIGAITDKILKNNDPAVLKLQALLQQSSPFLSRELALADSANLIFSANRTLQEGNLAEIRRAADAGGASSGALSQLLANDATTRASEALARTQLKTIVDYTNTGIKQRDQVVNTADALGKLQTQDVQQLVALLGIAKGATTTVNQSRNVAKSGLSTTSRISDQNAGQDSTSITTSA